MNTVSKTSHQNWFCPPLLGVVEDKSQFFWLTLLEPANWPPHVITAQQWGLTHKHIWLKHQSFLINIAECVKSFLDTRSSLAYFSWGHGYKCVCCLFPALWNNLEIEISNDDCKRCLLFVHNSDVKCLFVLLRCSCLFFVLAGVWFTYLYLFFLISCLFCTHGAKMSLRLTHVLFCLSNMSYCIESHIQCICIYLMFFLSPLLYLSLLCFCYRLSFCLCVSSLSLWLSHCLSQAKVPVNMDDEAVP